MDRRDNYIYTTKPPAKDELSSHCYEITYKRRKYKVKEEENDEE